MIEIKSLRGLVSILLAGALTGFLACGGYGDDGYTAPTSPEARDSTAAGSPPGDPGSPY